MHANVFVIHMQILSRHVKREMTYSYFFPSRQGKNLVMKLTIMGGKKDDELQLVFHPFSWQKCQFSNRLHASIFSQCKGKKGRYCISNGKNTYRDTCKVYPQLIAEDPLCLLIHHEGNNGQNLRGRRRFFEGIEQREEDFGHTAAAVQDFDFCP